MDRFWSKVDRGNPDDCWQWCRECSNAASRAYRSRKEVAA